MIGDRLYHITGKESLEDELVNVSQRHASELVSEINEFVVVVTRHEHDLLNLCRIWPQKNLQVSIGDITHYPSGWYTTATGRILLAYASKQDRKEILSQIGLPSPDVWPKVFDEEMLEARLDEIRRGESVHLNIDEDVDAFAVPAADADGVFSISIACVLPVTSYSAMSKDVILTHLKDTARRVGKELTLKGISVSNIRKISKREI